MKGEKAFTKKKERQAKKKKRNKEGKKGKVIPLSSRLKFPEKTPILFSSSYSIFAVDFPPILRERKEKKKISFSFISLRSFLFVSKEHFEKYLPQHQKQLSNLSKKQGC